MSITDDTLLELWHLALTTELGIAIPAPKHELRWLMQNLWRVRQGSGDPELDTLHIVTPQNVEEIWICRKLTNLSGR